MGPLGSAAAFSVRGLTGSGMTWDVLHGDRRGQGSPQLVALKAILALLCTGGRAGMVGG